MRAIYHPYQHARPVAGAHGGEIADPTPLTETDLQAMFDELSNWGRWGADDERGALNFITADVRRQAMALARDGITVSCALPLAVTPAPDNPNPVRHLMTAAGDVAGVAEGLQSTGNYFAIAPHGFAITHLDALCHVLVGGKMYNGFDASAVKSNGAEKNSIMAAKDGVVGRGVLLDIPALRGVDYLEPAERIEPAELVAAEQRQGVDVREGDILLVATGRDARRDRLGAWSAVDPGLAGLSAHCLPFIYERGVAVLGSDGVSDARPGNPPQWPLPVHQIAIASMGVHLIDNAQLGRLIATCRERNRYEFLATLAPLRLERGTASPINPIAMF